MAKKLKPKRYTTKKVSPNSYEALDGEWRAIGLSGPARRALVDAKLYKVSDLRLITLNELNATPGLAKSAVARIKVIMEAKKISFR
jgi:hypothetical protein